ncbi:MAG: hypothetical protein KJ638_14540 [Chloroflexi bacterium]|nr:hypothetical protein [Chloroflexota bacterium]
MISANEWWAVLQNYSLSIFPTQIVFYLLAVAMLAVFFTQHETSANRVIKGGFVLAFGWIGIVFFLLLGQELPAHNAQAFLFLSLSVLFAVDFFTNTYQFSMPRAGWQQTLTMIGFGLVMAYPLFGILLGRPASRWIIPGTFPCPTVALALVFMATMLPSRNRWLYLITLGLLLLWAIPFPIMIQIPQFGVYEDSIMLLMGLYSLGMLIRNWRLIGKQNRHIAGSVGA